MDLYKQAMYESFFDELVELQKLAWDNPIGNQPTLTPQAASQLGTESPTPPTPGMKDLASAPISAPAKPSSRMSSIWKQQAPTTNFGERVVAGARQLTQKGGLRKGLGAVRNVAKHQGLGTALTKTHMGALGTAGAIGTLGLGALGLGASALSGRGQGGNA